MTNPAFLHPYTPFFPPGPATRESGSRAKRPFDNKPPRQPDWILILMGVLFLLTILILWFVDFPRLFR